MVGMLIRYCLISSLGFSSILSDFSAPANLHDMIRPLTILVTPNMANNAVTVNVGVNLVVSLLTCLAINRHCATRTFPSSFSGAVIPTTPPSLTAASSIVLYSGAGKLFALSPPTNKNRMKT